MMVNNRAAKATTRAHKHVFKACISYKLKAVMFVVVALIAEQNPQQYFTVVQPHCPQRGGCLLFVSLPC